MTEPADRHSQMMMACEAAAPISSASSSSSPSPTPPPPPPPPPPPHPRVYVPFSTPDSSLPTYAVLEFVGFSSPSSSSSAAAASAPSMMPLPPNHLISLHQHQHQHQHHSHLHPSPPPSAALPLCLPHLSFSPNLLISPHRSSSDSPSSYLRPSAPPPSAHLVQLLDSPPLSPSSSVMTPSSAGDRPPPPAPSLDSPLLTIATPFPSASSARMAPAAGAESMGSVSISQNDRETIVHTNSSNFKDVVRQLTGASSQDQDLMPVTLPARLANRVSAGTTGSNTGGGSIAIASAAATSGPPPPTASHDACKLLPESSPVVSMSRSDGSNKSSGVEQQLGLRKAPLKLHERRKALRNLERLSTSAIAAAGACFRTELSSAYSSSSPAATMQNCSVNLSSPGGSYSLSSNCSASGPVPSPVTPLASDFERFCNATTPTAANGGGHHAMGGAIACSPREAVSCSPRYATSACSPRFAGGAAAEDGVYAATRGGSGRTPCSPRLFEDGVHAMRGPCSSPRLQLLDDANKRGGNGSGGHRISMPPPPPPLHYLPPSPHHHHPLNLNSYPGGGGTLVSAPQPPHPESPGPVLLNLFPDSPARGSSS